MSKDSGTTIKVIKHGPSGWVAMVAFIGAFVYFSHNAHNFADVLWAFVQALVWPGILIYHVLLFVGA